MGLVNPAQFFMKQKVDILRPAFGIDVTTIRDKVLTSYVLVHQFIRGYMEITHSDRIGNAMVGNIGVNSVVWFFAKNTDVQINDVLREQPTKYNGNVIRYFDVTGVLPYSQNDFLVRVDANIKNFQRGQ